jgi:hypothetical protein
MPQKQSDTQYLKLIEQAEFISIKQLAFELGIKGDTLLRRLYAAKKRLRINELVRITSIPHKAQRYNTVGDWQFIAGEFDKILDKNIPNLRIRISNLSDERYMYLVAIHEYIEAIICKYTGITEKDVDNWDINYSGKYNEPGDDPLCPYNLAHSFATVVEREIAKKIKVNWEEYEKEIESLCQK